MTFKNLLEGKKLKWKKIGDQYTAYYDDPKDILGLFMKQSKSFNDSSASYEVQEMNGIKFKKFSKITDAKKYIESFLK